LKTKYHKINTELGRTGAGLTVDQIRDNPDLSDVLGVSAQISVEHVLRSSCSDQLILAYKLLVWECLHGFWRTLLNFNPHAVLSEPGQDLGGEAQSLMFPSHSNGNASEDKEPKDNIVEDGVEDASLQGVVGHAAGDIDVEVGFEGFNNNALDKV